MLGSYGYGKLAPHRHHTIVETLVIRTEFKGVHDNESWLPKVTRLGFIQTFQPPPFPPPSHANWEVLKTSPEKPGDWDLKPGDFQSMPQIKKKKKTNYLFECFFTFLVPPVVFFCCFFRSRVLEKGGHFQICACVWKLSFPRDLSAPMFYWKWHCTQVFSQISLINRLLWTQIIRYSFILCRSFRHCQGFLAHREI